MKEVALLSPERYQTLTEGDFDTSEDSEPAVASKPPPTRKESYAAGQFGFPVPAHFAEEPSQEEMSGISLSTRRKIWPVKRMPRRDKLAAMKSALDSGAPCRDCNALFDAEHKPV